MTATFSPSIATSRKCACSNVCEEPSSNEIDFLFKGGSVVRDASGEMPCTSVAVLHYSCNMPHVTCRKKGEIS